MSESSNCSQACFPANAAISRETVASQPEALALLKRLIADGRLPMLCQSADMRFRVCHAPPPA